MNITKVTTPLKNSMNELYDQIKTVYSDLNASKYSTDTKLSVFRGFLLDMLAKSYGYSSWDVWLDAIQNEDY